MEPELNECSGGLGPARGREAPLYAAGRITVGSVAIKIERRIVSSGSALKRAFEINRLQSRRPVFDRRAIWL